VRPERPTDVAAIRIVHERAFAPSGEEADLVDALRRSAELELSLVGMAEDAVVAHIAFSRAHVGDEPVLALAPMGVLPEYQRRGIGSALVSEGLRRASRTTFPLVVVLGHPAYYPRFGFEPAEPLGIGAPFTVPAEAWMAYRLPAYRPDVRGSVAYAAAFGI
jgi:putative acetyltransferase